MFRSLLILLLPLSLTLGAKLTADSALYCSNDDVLTHDVCSTDLKDQFTDALMTYSGEPEGLPPLIEAGRKAGVPEQTIREALYAYFLESRDESGLASLAESFLAARDYYKESDSELFSHKDDWLGAVAFLQAIKKRRAGDLKGFEDGVKTAFWLSPKQAAEFAPCIEKHQTRLALQQLTVSPDFRLAAPSGKHVSFKQWRKGAKAVIFHFWSPWSMECAHSLPDYKTTKKALKDRGFKIVSVVVQPTQKLRAELPAFLRRMNLSPEDLYYDNLDNSLSGQLRILNLPSVALVTTKGQILFCGAPQDPEFWEQLHLLDPEFLRPFSSPAKKSPSPRKS